MGNICQSINQNKQDKINPPLVSYHNNYNIKYDKNYQDDDKMLPDNSLYNSPIESLVNLKPIQKQPSFSESSIKILEKYLECPTCLEYFNSKNNRPMLIPCQHTICSKCIRDFIKAS